MPALAVVRYFHEAREHEEATDHAVCEPKERLAEHSCGCAVCVDQRALHDGPDTAEASSRLP